MKKTRTRDIPDFSAMRKRPASGPSPDPKTTHGSQTPERNIKPQATSAKSGRRGQ